MNILLVEDIESIIKGLTYSLEKSNYKLVIKTTIKDTKEYLLSNTNIDLIILDITLPDGNGFDLFVNTIKNLKIPTIFLTAKDEEDDIVKGLDIGAEDYITKPFSTREVIARINRILLRCKKKSIIKIKDISYDMDKLVLMKNNTPIELTALELKLVNLLFVNINKVVSNVVRNKPSYITIEDLNVKGMMRNKHLSKAVAQQKFNEFRNKLANKCNAFGIELRIVDRFYPSSKLCHKCGSIKKDLKLKDRIFNCDCGYVEDRDYNASLNLRDAKIYKIA